jgi:hypothetical protein
MSESKRSGGSHQANGVAIAAAVTAAPSDTLMEETMTSSWNPEWSKTAAFQKEYRRMVRRNDAADRLTRWMLHIPVLGKFTRDFWYLLIAEGFRSTLKPRWGGITFAYLNDGCGATVWHTWRQMTHDQTDPYTGIYIMGAPRSLKEAEAMEAEFRKVKG